MLIGDRLKSVSSSLQRAGEKSPALFLWYVLAFMTVTRNPDMRVQHLAIGREGAPLLVVDNLVGNPADLVELAATKMFAMSHDAYPGTRAKAPLTYQRFVLETLRPEIDSAFGLAGR